MVSQEQGIGDEPIRSWKYIAGGRLFDQFGLMRDNWFLALDTQEVDEAAIQKHLCRVCTAHPLPERHSFDLLGGRRMTVLGADDSRVVNNPRYWLRVVGPQPPAEALRRSLESAQTAMELRQACISAAGEGCSFFIIDKSAGDYSAITDLVNLAPIFHGEMGADRLFASGLSLFPRDGLTLDPGGVASYIVNGNGLNDHTIFREITHLSRASIHAFRESAHAQETYWRYAPGQKRRTPWRPAAAAEQLWDLLADSVDRATRGKRVLLSLSGGYDSSVLLGILGARLRHPDVVCFSYIHGRQRHRTDATVARAQATLYGYEHVAAVGYSGNFLRLLDTNATLGQGLRRPAYEVEAFSRLAERHPGTSNTVMLFGDECAGLDSYRMNRVDDILGAARLKSPMLLDRFETVLGAEPMARLRAALETEYDLLRAQARTFSNPDDAKDFIYLDQHLPFSLLALRTLYGGHWFAVATPLISREILDFMAAVPTDYRVGKRLFKQMARRFLKEQFRIARSIEGGSNPDFAREIAANCDLLVATIAERGWKIEGLLSAAELTHLLRQAKSELEANAWPRRARMPIRNQLARWIKTLLVSSPQMEDRQHWWRRRLINQYAELPEPAYLLVNVLCLAATLAEKHDAGPPAWLCETPATVEPKPDHPAGLDPWLAEGPQGVSASPPA